MPVGRKPPFLLRGLSYMRELPSERSREERIDGVGGERLINQNIAI
jgi:hypothetical protein